jgi:hypothetical protein
MIVNADAGLPNVENVLKPMRNERTAMYINE